MIRVAKQRGLAGIALTDHDSIDGWKEAAAEAKKQGMIFIQGEEVSTARGHILALGITEHIPRGLSVQETMDQIHEQGGIGIASHPFDIAGQGVRYDAKYTDAVEAWNALSIDRFSNYLNNRKAERLGKPKVSGSDAHTLDMIGTAPIRTTATTLDDILKSILKQQVTLTKQYVSIRSIQTWSQERFKRSYDHVWNHIANYSPPRAWISRKLLNRFVTDRSNWLFTGLAHVGICSAAVYSACLTAAKY